MTIMSEVKTIKDIDDHTWGEFKGLAARNNVKLGVFFKTLVHYYEEDATTFWDMILKCEKILSDREAEDLQRHVQRQRREPGFRT